MFPLWLLTALVDSDITTSFAHIRGVEAIQRGYFSFFKIQFYDFMYFVSILSTEMLAAKDY